jgi:hypothetical protein
MYFNDTTMFGQIVPATAGQMTIVLDCVRDDASGEVEIGISRRSVVAWRVAATQAWPICAGFNEAELFGETKITLIEHPDGTYECKDEAENRMIWNSADDAIRYWQRRLTGEPTLEHCLEQAAEAYLFSEALNEHIYGLTPMERFLDGLEKRAFRNMTWMNFAPYCGVPRGLREKMIQTPHSSRLEKINCFTRPNYSTTGTFPISWQSATFA